MFKLDQYRYGGGLILQINEQVPCKMLTSHENSIASEIIISEFYQLKKRKSLILGIYKSPKHKRDIIFTRFKLVIWFSYENIEDFTMQIKKHYVNEFMGIIALSCIINEKKYSRMNRVKFVKDSL